MPLHLWIVMELASAGFGSPEVLIRERVDLVLAAYDYLSFKNTYEKQCYELGKKD
jgi:hypothetical protein